MNIHSPEPIPARDKNGKPYTMETITDALCKWPHGDPRQPDFHLCGHPAEKVYCPHHQRKAWV